MSYFDSETEKIIHQAMLDDCRRNHTELDPECLQILKKARNDAMYQFFKRSYTALFNSEFVKHGRLPYEGEMPEKFKQELERCHDLISSKPPFMLVTINPRPDVTFDQLDKFVKRTIKKKSIESYAYVYEVRNEEKKEYTGLHCHILLKYNIPPSDFRRNVKNTVKSICNANNPQILNFKFVDEDILESKFRYLLGEKSDKKHKGVKITNEWRIQNNIKDIYESTPTLPCRGTQTIIEDNKMIENHSKET